MSPSASTTSNSSESSVNKPAANNDLEISKYSLRKEIWSSFDKNGLVTFPRPVRGRIPNFQGAGDAADNLKTTEVFQKAVVVKVNADKPQETVRVYALEAKDKRLVVSPRRGDSHPLLEIKLPEPPIAGTEPSPAVLRAAVTRQGMLTFSHPFLADEGAKIDLLVVGSVAVSRQGQRIGKCDGFSDLEFGYLSEIGVITKDTVIATTVHDSQVFDVLPPQLFREHDFPVDMIVTPTEVISVMPRAERPSGIIWKLLSNRRMLLSPNVANLHKELVEKGGECHLKEEDTDEETEREIRRKHRPYIHYFSRRSYRGSSDAGVIAEDKEKTKKLRKRRPLRSLENATTDDNKTNSDGEVKKAVVKRNAPRRRPWKRQRILFSIRIGGIASTDRVRDLKNALAARNVRPAEIAWFGRRGFAYVHFTKPKVEEPQVPVELEAVVATLKDMKLGEEVEGQVKAPIIVEPAPPSKREEQEKTKANGDLLKLKEDAPVTKLQETSKVSEPETIILVPVE